MTTNTFHHAIGCGQAHACSHSPKSRNTAGTFSVKISSKNLVSWKLYSTRASISHSLVDTAQLPSNKKSTSSRKKSNESVLTLVRHGESMWNEKNLLTGCVDVSLTEKGVEEAIQAGKRISNIPIDMIYTLSLIHTQMIAVIAMTQHRCKKVPIILHNESELARKWSKIHSKEARKQSISVITAWHLNERMYGDLQGLNKQETTEKLGKELVHEWRRAYSAPPPNSGNLEMCGQRAVAYFREHIEPQLMRGKNLMVTAHADSLRSIIMYLGKLTAEEVIDLEVLTGIPMLYLFKNGKFIRRGSPIAPTEDGVYAFSRRLARYRQKLDGDAMPDRHQ